MRKQDRRWLERIARASKPSASMYSGEREDFVPQKVARRLGALIALDYPHNPAHKGRYVITDAGLEALGGDDD